MIALIISPAHYINSANEGIMLWANNLLPALFPFFVLTKLLMEIDVLEPATRFLAPIMKKIFNTNSNSSYLFIISILSGYPVGSKIVADAYNLGKIDYAELHRLITFTSVSGPLFIIGTVGINMLSNSCYGYIILFSHIASAILNGVCYKNYTPKTMYSIKVENNKKTSKSVLTIAVKNSIDSILLIGGLVCLFYVSMDAISSLITLPPILQGIIEITKGCYEISVSNLSINLKTIICTGLITFGGLCIHSQAMYFLKECNVSYKFFLMQKLTQTFFAVTIASILVLFI
ncbi:MAG: nucleoside recognition domain-containing protein [Christensenellales bacterium]